MDFNIEEPPLKMTKKKKQNPSLSSLPDDIIVNCLARISKSQYPSLCLVSKSFYSLLSSRDIYAARSQIGVKDPQLYVCMWLPNHRSWFTLSETNKGELSLVRLKLSSSFDSCYARLNATTVAAGSEIYQIGGAVKAKRSKTVLVVNCWSHTWRHGPNLKVARKNATSWFLDGKIYVIGGCIKKEEAMNWVEVFDLKSQTWTSLPIPPREDVFAPNHKVEVFGGRLYVFTKSNKKYAYDPKEGRWVPEVGFVGLEPINSINGPWCVIENVIFTHDCGYFKWYNPRYGKWDIVYGLGDVNSACHNRVVQLVNHGGKLVVIWHEWIEIDDGTKCKRIWCAVIRLEKYLRLFKL